MTTKDLDSLRAKGINPYIIIDTVDFGHYCEVKHGYTNSTFHSKIWRPYMCNYFMNGESYVCFDKYKNPKNEFEEMMNAFLDDYPEFNGNIKMIFTN